MKRFFASVFGLLAIFSTFIPLPALAKEVIRDFSVHATLESNRALTITEEIEYDFGETPRHGIFRVIPNRYTRKGIDYTLHLSVEGVQMDGASVPYESSYQGADLHIKIGDPDETITGPHTYAITYTTDRAINFFEDHSELFWNVTGNDWEVPIEAASFRFLLSDDILSPLSDVDCFTGAFGESGAACEIEEEIGGVRVAATGELGRGDGLSVVVGIPVGVIAEPTAVEQFLMVARDNIHFAVPILALIVMLTLWFFRGRDPKLGTVIPLYESPEGRLPYELSAIRDEGAFSHAAFTASILHLASRGYLHIRSSKKKGKVFTSSPTFTFVKKKDADDKLTPQEQTLLDAIFTDGDEVEVKDLDAAAMAGAQSGFRKKTHSQMRSEKLFYGTPAAIRSVVTVVASMCTWFLIVVFVNRPFGVLVGIATGVIIFAVGWFMPRRTQKGAELLTKIKGFEWYLRVAEKDRLEFHNPPHKTSEHFFALLPFAIALGVEREWARQFQGIPLTKPEWVEGSGWSFRNAAVFTSSVRQFSTATIARSHVSSAGSGSSGFSGGSSGGGFGGGGGGSW